MYLYKNGAVKVAAGSRGKNSTFCLGEGIKVSYGKKDRYQAILSRFAAEQCRVFYIQIPAA